MGDSAVLPTYWMVEHQQLLMRFHDPKCEATHRWYTPGPVNLGEFARVPLMVDMTIASWVINQLLTKGVCNVSKVDENEMRSEPNEAILLLQKAVQEEDVGPQRRSDIVPRLRRRQRFCPGHWLRWWVRWQKFDRSRSQSRRSLRRSLRILMTWSCHLWRYNWPTSKSSVTWALLGYWKEGPYHQHVGFSGSCV